jgi:hypothetical protein
MQAFNMAGNSREGIERMSGVIERNSFVSYTTRLFWVPMFILDCYRVSTAHPRL